MTFEPFPNLELALSYGKNRKKLTPFTISLTDMHWVDDHSQFVGTVRVDGLPDLPVSKERSDQSPFHFINTNLSGLRQILRTFQDMHPGVKFFADIGGELAPQSVEDIFWVHDCLPD